MQLFLWKSFAPDSFFRDSLCHSVSWSSLCLIPSLWWALIVGFCEYWIGFLTGFWREFFDWRCSFLRFFFFVSGFGGCCFFVSFFFSSGCCSSYVCALLSRVVLCVGCGFFGHCWALGVSGVLFFASAFAFGLLLSPGAFFFLSAVWCVLSGYPVLSSFHLRGLYFGVCCLSFQFFFLICVRHHLFPSSPFLSRLAFFSFLVSSNFGVVCQVVFALPLLVLSGFTFCALIQPRFLYAPFSSRTRFRPSVTRSFLHVFLVTTPLSSWLTPALVDYIPRVGWERWACRQEFHSAQLMDAWPVLDHFSRFCLSIAFGFSATSCGVARLSCPFWPLVLRGWAAICWARSARTILIGVR